MPPKNPWVLPDGFDDNVKKAFAEITAAFANAQKSIPKEALEALRNGYWQDFLSIIRRENLGSAFGALEGILGNVAKEAAVSIYKKSGAGAKLTFDIIDEYSVNFASSRTGFLIKDIEEEMRLTVQRTITEATLGDITWQEAADQIGEYIPLTARDAGAVKKYHDRMLKRYIDRKGWREKEARKYAKSLSDKYAEKLTKSRARTIARTEIANAATEGQYIGWEAGVQSGQIDADSLKEWIAEPNACEYCGAIDGQTVRWDANFEVLGGKLMPPAHPNCRCAVAILPPDYADTPFTSQALQKSKGWWDQFEIEFAKHLAGKHDQSSHGRKGTASAPAATPTRQLNFYGRGEYVDFIPLMNARGVSNYELAKFRADVNRYPNEGDDWESIKNNERRINSEAVYGIAEIGGAWDRSSSEPISLAMHERAATVFGLRDASPPEARNQADFDKSQDIVAKHSKVIDAYLQINYEHTQDYLAKNGITEITVYRGSGQSISSFGVSPSFTDQPVTLRSRPISSWTVAPEIAVGFAWNSGNSNAVVLTHTFAAKDIFSTALTGVGKTSEREVVVFGGITEVQARQVIPKS